MACCRTARNTALVVGGLALGTIAGWVGVVALTGLGIATPDPGAADPAPDPADARERWARLRAREGAEVRPECHGELFTPTGSDPPIATIAIFHGFTNCPAQFQALGAELASRGYAVFIPRAPYHGLTDPRGLALRDLTTEDLVAHVHNTVDIAAGLGRPVWVLGLSTGGVLAEWAGATRHEVERVLAIAPAASPYKVGLPIVRVAVALRHLMVFNRYFWWDFKLKDQLSDSGGNAYPGFPFKAIVSYWRLAVALADRRVVPNHLLESVVLLLNPEDRAVDPPAARDMTANAFTGFASRLAELDLPPGLGWGHDFVDQHNEHHAATEQLSSIVRAGFGVNEAPLQEGFVASKAL